MKSFLKWLAIGVGVVLVLLILGAACLPFIFPLEKIKAFAVAKLSETLHREVKIEKVSFDLFSGIKLKGLYIGNHKSFSPKPFVSAAAIELRYAFWPLFTRQILVKEIRIVAPQVLIEKNARGEFNFSDLTQGNKKPGAGKGTKPPFDLFISSFSIKGGSLSYVDHSAKTTAAINDLNVKVTGFELALVKPIDIKIAARANYQGKEIPLSLTGRIGVNLAQESIVIPALSLSIAGESLFASGTITGWKRAPQLTFALNSKKINLDPLLAVFAAPAKTGKPQRGELTGTVNRFTAAIPGNLGLNGDIKIENLTLRKFKVDKLNLSVALARKKVAADLKEIRIYGGTLSARAGVDLNVPGLGYEVRNLQLAGFNAAPFSNAVVETFLANLDLLNKVYGTLDLSASLKGRGVEPQDFLANAVADGSLTIKNGKLKRLKMLADLGKMIKSNSLQEDILFGALAADFGLRDKIVTVKTLKLDKPEFKVNFKGDVDLGNLVWVPGNRLTLKLSPALTKNLPKEYSLLKDSEGWFELTLEITGSLKKPIPRPILKKPLEVAVGKLKVKVEAAKVELQQQASAEIDRAKEQLKEEAKNKLKEFLKF